jgi:outer membrane protein assembly factor BamB
MPPAQVRGQSFESMRDENWHQWRGPEANGVSRTARPPIEWGEDKNVQWKVAIEGNGGSTPIVWGERVFLLTAIDTGRIDPSLPKPEDQPERMFGIKHPNTSFEFVVLCLDRASGDEIWRQTATVRVPHEGHHGDNSFASASPTTDGQRLYCWFGSAGLYCYDLAGEKLWERDLGKVVIPASLGEGCSPVIHERRLIIVRDQEEQSYIEVLDAATGDTIWRKDRDEPGSWATPLAVEHDGTTQVITSGANLVRSYDLADWRVIWQCGGLTSNAIPSPVVEDGVVYCMTGHQGYSLLAIPLSATGDISGSETIVWTKDKATPYTPSPLLYDRLLYFNQSNQAILSCLDAKTGDTRFGPTRLTELSGIYASPVGADGRVYVTGRSGTTLVLERSGELNVLATNKLEDRIDASAAVAGNQLLLRGKEFLYCIAE